MFECPNCDSIHFDYEEIDYRPYSAPLAVISCAAKNCKTIIGIHEKGIYDLLKEINEKLERL